MMGGCMPRVVLLLLARACYVPHVTAQVGSTVVATQQQQDWSGVTLSFVIDTTGSMSDDLRQVRNGVQSIFKAISQQKEIPVLNYALVTFNDPDVNLATLTADQTTFENAVEASLSVGGGGDCPEMAIGGINLALQRSLPRSFIFVFTDASAKDHHLKSQALGLIQETQSQVIFVMTGDCDDQSGPRFQAFKDIAAASAGQIFFLREKNEVSKVLKFIEISVNARRVNILSVETGAGRATYAIPVDSSLQQLIVSVSTAGNVQLTSPSGGEFIPSVDLGSVVVINVTSPMQGWWNLVVDSSQPYSVRVKGVSLADFETHFTVDSGTQRVFVSRPVEGQPPFIVLQASNGTGSLLVTGMQLLDLAGVVLRDIPLNWNTSQPYPQLEHPGFETPQQLFYVRVRGRDSRNATFYRLTPTPVKPGQPSPPTVIDWLTNISGDLGGSVQLRCDYRSLVQPNVVWFRDGVPIATINRDDPRFLVLADGKLRITQLSPDDATCYHCQVISIAGNDTGRPVCLKVLQPLRITQPVAGTCNSSTALGSSFQLLCTAVGDPTPSIRWEKDGVRISSTSRVEISSNGLLRVRQAKFSDSGRYTCVAEDGVGTPVTRDCYTQLSDVVIAAPRSRYPYPRFVAVLYRYNTVNRSYVVVEEVFNLTRASFPLAVPGHSAGLSLARIDGVEENGDRSTLEVQNVEAGVEGSSLLLSLPSPLITTQTIRPGVSQVQINLPVFNPDQQALYQNVDIRFRPSVGATWRQNFSSITSRTYNVPGTYHDGKYEVQVQAVGTDGQQSFVSVLAVVTVRAVGCGRFLANSSWPLVEATGRVAADIVLVIDESSSMEVYQEWLAGTVGKLEDALTAKGIGSTASLRNHFAVVGFGRGPPPLYIGCTQPRAFRNAAGEKVFTVDSYPDVNSQLVAHGSHEDGYVAIKYALENITDERGANLLRLDHPDVVTNVILVTDEDRDTCGAHGRGINKASLKRLMRRSGAVLNVVADQRVRGDASGRAIGLDSKRVAYIAEASGNYSSMAGGSISWSFHKTKRDYSSLALALGGTAWDIDILKQGGDASTSFTNAFLEVKTREIAEQLEQCRYCQCVGEGESPRLSCRIAAKQAACKHEVADEALQESLLDG